MSGPTTPWRWASLRGLGNAAYGRWVRYYGGSMVPMMTSERRPEQVPW